MTFVVVVIIVASGTFYLAQSSQTTNSLSTTTSASETSKNSSSLTALPVCDTPASYHSVAMQVESTPAFKAAEGNITGWILVYAGNETGYVGNATTTMYHRDVAFNFYSFLNSADYNYTLSTCQYNTSSVEYVLYATLPISSDGSYNLNGVNAYSEAYHSNGTSG